MQKTVASILGEKGKDVWSIGSDASVYEALELLAEKNIGAVVVADGGRLAGILSERDYARKVVLLDRVSKETKVSEIMTPNVVTVTPDTAVSECSSLMTEHRIRHLPVVEGDDIVGLVSIGDVVRAEIAEREFLITQMEQYIQS